MMRAVVMCAALAATHPARADDDGDAAPPPTPAEMHEARKAALDDADRAIKEAARVIRERMGEPNTTPAEPESEE